jgi:hypothetical protein
MEVYINILQPVQLCEWGREKIHISRIRISIYDWQGWRSLPPLHPSTPPPRPPYGTLNKSLHKIFFYIFVNVRLDYNWFYSLKVLAHFRPKKLVDFLHSITQINCLNGAIIARHIYLTNNYVCDLPQFVKNLSYTTFGWICRKDIF